MKELKGRDEKWYVRTAKWVVGYGKSIAFGTAVLTLLIPGSIILLTVCIATFIAGFVNRWSDVSVASIKENCKQQLFLCWQNDNSILGVATTEKEAQKMCTEVGDSYFPLLADTAERSSVETTEDCIYKTEKGFKTYHELNRTPVQRSI